MIAVDDYLKVKRQMDAYRGKKHAAMDEIAQEWLKYVRLGKDKATVLATLMHDATLAGIDPAATDEETASKPGWDDYWRRFMALPGAGRELYVKVRDAYKAQAAELDRILLDNVRKAQEIAQRRAEARYKKEIERIAQAGLSKQARKDAEEDMSSDAVRQRLLSVFADPRFVTDELVREDVRINTSPGAEASLGQWSR